MNRFRLASWLLIILTVFPAALLEGASNDMKLLFVGSGRKNISAFRLDESSGSLTPIGEAAPVEAPSFLTVSPNGRMLFAVTEGGNKEDSFINAFRIDAATGKLSFLNRQPSGGAGPCHVAMDHKGRVVLAANYGGGSVVVFPLYNSGDLQRNSAFIQDEGSSVNQSRQSGPHAHCIVSSPDDRFAFACDLGADKVMIFKLDAETGSLAANDPPFVSLKPGAGPRHIVFHPNGRFACVINELSCTLTMFAYDAKKGALTEIDDQPLLPADFKKPNTAAEVAFHPSGKFVYASNRGEDSIVVFGCNSKTGKLSFIERVLSGGKTPRHFAIDPSGSFLLAANQNSGSIVVFRIDKKTGRLSPTGFTATADTPECVAFLEQK